MSLAFVASAPQKAREEIMRLRGCSRLSDGEQAIVDRLAADPAMNEVWEKLPCKDETSGAVVLRAFDAVRLALAKRPPIPKRGNRAREKYVLETAKSGPNYTLENVAMYALMLRESIIATREPMQSPDPELNLDELLAKVDYIERAYKAANEQNGRYWKEFHCPRIRTARAKNAAEIRFSKMMSHYFKEQFRQPLDAVVAALMQAVFGQSKGVSEEAVRERRRQRAL